MNVGLLTVNEGWGWGGTEIHNARLARTLDARGHQATVVCVSEGGYRIYRERCSDDVNVALVPTPKSPRRMQFMDWIRFFRGKPWDLCVLVKGELWDGDWQLDVAARLLCPHYFTIEHLTAVLLRGPSRTHFGFIPGMGLYWKRVRFRGKMRSIGPKKIVCVSDAVRTGLIEYGFPADKMVTVHNGIDTSRFRPDPEARSASRSAWGIPAEALVFGAIGRFAKIKGYEAALDGFERVLQRFPERDIRLVLAGEGEHERTLRERAERIAPGGRVRILPFSSRPWETLNGFDIFVMPSLNEGLPLALLEAMASGCVPVASTAGGIPEILRSSDLGWLVPVGDTAAFGGAMIDAASQPAETLLAMRRRVRAHIEASFNATTQFDLLVDTIESAAARRWLRLFR